MAKIKTKPSEFCRQAAQLILSKGLCQEGEYEGDDGSLCILGALQKVKADYDPTVEQSIVDEIKRAAGIQMGMWISKWNDAETTTRDDVYTAMVRAAESMEARGL